MMATAWNNGSHHLSGAGYGIKIEPADRDLHFRREWKVVALNLVGVGIPVEVNIDKPSFWGKTCRELINKEIGLWLFAQGKAPWPNGEPPRLEVLPIGDAQFRVRLVE